MKLHQFVYSLACGAFVVQLTSVRCDTPTKNYTAYRPSPHCSPSHYMRYPTSADDVVAIVNEAIRLGVTVKAFGARHSQTDIICTDGIPIDMTKLKFFQMNSDGVTANFGPGVTVEEAGAFLLKNRRALRTTPAYGGITLGGALGTGAHGSTIKYNSTISAQVIRMTVVNGLGQIVEINTSDELKAFRVNLGLLGIVVSITLHTVPLYKILAHNFVVSEDVLTDGTALNWAENSDQIIFYWFPSFKEVVVANLTFVSADTYGNAYSNAIPLPTYGYFSFVANRAKEFAYSLSASDCALASGVGNTIAHAFEITSKSLLLRQTPGSVPIYTEDGYTFKNPAVGHPHRMLAVSCSEENAGFTGMSCAWAHGDINSNITVVDNDKSDAYMSTSFGRDTIHAEFGVWKRTDSYNEPSGSLAGYQTMLQTVTKELYGRSHWGKSGLIYHSSEMLDLKLDPSARDQFIAAMKKSDPNGIFINDFGRRILKSGTKINSDPLTTRCALLDNCFCSKNSDCASMQTCTTLPGYPTYRVCKTKNEVSEKQLNRKKFPPPAGILNWLIVAVPNLLVSTFARCPPAGLLNTTTNVLGSILGWMRDIYKLGTKGTLKPEDIYQVKHELESKMITENFIRLWTDEIKMQRPSMFRLLCKSFGAPILFWCLCYSSLDIAMRISHSLCLGGLVEFFTATEPEISKGVGLMYAGGLFLSLTISAISCHPYMILVDKVASHIKIGLTGIVYRKMLRLSLCSIYGNLNGKIIKVMADDVHQFGMALECLHHTWKGPVESVIFAYFIYREINVAGLVGCSILLCFMPLQAFLARKATKLQTKLSKLTEERVRITSETIIGIRIIKMYGLEHVFKDVITNVRSAEMVILQSLHRIQALLVTLSLLTRLSILVSLVTFLYLGQTITPHKEFITFALFNLLNWSMMWQWPFALIQCGQGYVAIKRIQNFLLNSEETSRNTSINNNNGNSDQILNRCIFAKGSQETTAIHLENVTSKWLAASNRVAGVFNSSLSVASGELCALIGPVGSGKSTLLHVVTGELNIKRGFCEIYGKISYASQMPWIFEGTLRQNITFAEPFDETKFQKVIRVCCLENDIEQMPHKELTLLGECGFTLSGGQRSRINLARAVYRNADIYIFDDVLAAVDFKVGKYIVQHCIQEYLTGHTRIIVTNELQYFKYAQHLIVMLDGRIEADGTFEEIQNQGLLSFCQLKRSDVVNNDETFLTQKFMTSLLTVPDDDGYNERRVENPFKGSRVDVYTFYFRSVRSVHFLVLVVFLFIISQFFAGVVDSFLSSWNTGTGWEISFSTSKIKTLSVSAQNGSNEPTNSEAPSSENHPFISLNCSFMALCLVTTIYRSFQFFELCLSASIALHTDLFLHILRARMKFFDLNPSGRILKRFSKDLLHIDTRLPQALIEFLTFVLELLTSVIMVLSVDVWLLIPSTIIAIFFCALRYVFTNTTKSVQRIESISLSPLYSYVNNTLQGLSTIRISNVDNILEEEFYGHLDFNTATTYVKAMTSRAFSAWVDGICLVYVGICALLFVVYRDSSASSDKFGFALLHCINLIGMCQWGTRDATEIENEMTSVERIIEYTKIESEPPLKVPSDHLPKHWPSSGGIVFKNVEFKYSNSRAVVLKDLSFRINPGEKIGIIGHTGAGKTSIIEAIFRMQEYSGEIIIDGILTTTLGLHDLRKNISYIPQHPVLFSASLRFNLDPFGEASDNELWSALNQVEMKEFIKQLPGGLAYKLVKGGLNLSMGQRQLISLARAIVRNKKILISDEATASIDPETDRLIRDTIRLNFTDCTVLTISHQLYNVMDSDRILVMQNGSIVEFDRPVVLMQQSDGYLRKMVYCHDPATIENLTNLARK